LLPLGRSIFSTTVFANAIIGGGALLLLPSTNFGSSKIVVTLLHKSLAVTTLVPVLIVDVISDVISVWIIVLVFTVVDTECPVRGAKYSAVASLVKYRPLHFSASVSGVENRDCNLFSSCIVAMADFDIAAPPLLL